MLENSVRKLLTVVVGEYEFLKYILCAPVGWGDPWSICYTESLSVPRACIKMWMLWCERQELGPVRQHFALWSWGHLKPWSNAVSEERKIGKI